MYIINSNTLYLKSDNFITWVKEVSQTLQFSGNIIDKILNDSCIYYGSSLKGRIEGSKNILGSRYKLPIIVSDRNNWIFFPIKVNKDIIWFNFTMISNYKKCNNEIEIYYKNFIVEKYNISYTIFNNQMLKCSRLWMIYLTRS